MHSSQRLASFIASGLVRTYDLFNHQFRCIVTSDQHALVEGTCKGTRTVSAQRYECDPTSSFEISVQAIPGQKNHMEKKG